MLVYERGAMIEPTSTPVPSGGIARVMYELEIALYIKKKLYEILVNSMIG